MAFPLIPLIAAGAQIASGLIGANSAKSQNKAADAQAQREMDFQERMSSTSHQREVADLRAAGLNPILSAHGGASSPGGAMAPVVNTSEPLRDSIKNSAASALDSANVMLIRESAKTQQTQQQLNLANAEAIRGKVSFPGFYSGTSSSFLGGVNRVFNSAKSTAKKAVHHFNPMNPEGFYKPVVRYARAQKR